MSKPLLTDPRILQLNRIKPTVPPQEPGDMVRLPLRSKAFIYQRLSTHEQRKKNLWSLEMQDALAEQAKADGYREDQIIVERRDLGISGTKGWEERPGLAALIRAIEADEVEAVYVVHISRISRDQTLIDGLEFGELCKQHHVLIVMPTMRLNLRDAMHLRLYRQEIERAADEIELLKMRLGGPRRHKALSGRFDGRSVAPGYLIDHNAQSESYERYVIYPPHAEVVRAIFRAVLATGTPTRAARWLRERGILFPYFRPEVPPEDIMRSSLIRIPHPSRRPGGFAISRKLVQSIATNPVYLGWWLVDGRVVHTNNHPAIIEEETFVMAQETMTQHGRKHGRSGGLGSPIPQLLSGLVWCVRHEVPQKMYGVAHGHGRYICDHGYHNAQTDHHCTLLDARILDEPITDVVLQQCGFAEYAESVLDQIETEYNVAREEARRRQRELTHLQQEVETLKHNLALTRSPEQVAIIFEQVDRRMQRMAELSDVNNMPVGRTLSAAQVATVKAFLADLRLGWAKQPSALKNELLRLILERVLVKAERDYVEAKILWRSGPQQRLWIERPPRRWSGNVPWSEEDNAWLRAHYATATREERQARFPHRMPKAIVKQARRLGLNRPLKGIAKPNRPLWTEDENELLRAYVMGQSSYAELRAKLPGRTWEAIESQRWVLGLRHQQHPIYYRLDQDIGDIVSKGSPPSATS
jgi:DNA invertase Pin-like site-specific DNA recombinase